MGKIDDDFDVETTEAQSQQDGVETSTDTDIQPEAEVQADSDAQPDGEPELTDEQAEAKAAADKAAEDKAAEDKAKAAAEYESAIAAFKEAVEATLTHEDRDQSTGTLPEAVKQTVTMAYAQLPGARAKKSARDYLLEQMQAQMLLGTPESYLQARTYLDLNQGVQVSAPRETVVRQPIDPTDAHVALVTAIFVAPNLVLPGDGVTSDWQEKVKAKATELKADTAKYREWLVANVGKPADERSDAPEVDPIVVNAAKLAHGRGMAVRKVKTADGSVTTVRAPYDGVRRDIGAHIKSAFEGKPSGTFLTIAEIVNHESSEYGGSNPKPSPGAVSARLFPKSGNCTIPDVRPEGEPEGREKKGAVKV